MILILGKNSQLNKEFSKIYKKKKISLSSKNLNFLNQKKFTIILKKFNPNVVLNFAAFNDLDKAEDSKENFLINAKSLKYISNYCKKKNILLIHVSTDNVFDGKKFFYTESSKTNPINKYGKAKLQGEKIIKKIWYKHIILRTSWLYSSHSKNFFSTIQKLIFNKKTNIIFGATDHISSPTSARSLAQAIDFLVRLYLSKSKLKFGLYNFVNKGHVSKYDFIKKIYSNFIKYKKIKKKIKLIKVKFFFFRLRAKRPFKTILITNKFAKNFNYTIKDWKSELKLVVKSSKC